MFASAQQQDLQPTLFGMLQPAVDVRFRGAHRIWLDEFSWIEVVPGWLRGAEELYYNLQELLPWRQRTVPMYERMVTEPRLVWWWQTGGGTRLPLPILLEMRMLLSIRYGVVFDSVGANYYRDGRDSVAWHRDRAASESTIAIVSTGAPRPFLVRPRGGGASRAFLVGHGDLLTLGGRSNDDWEHTVPKIVHAGPRISLVFREETLPSTERSESYGSGPRS